MHLYLCTGCKGEWRPTLISVTQEGAERLIVVHGLEDRLPDLAVFFLS